MKVEIYIGDTEGEFISPMDEKTRCSPIDLDVFLWTAELTIGEEDSDHSSEAGTVGLVALVEDFIDTIKPNHPVSDTEKHNEECEETFALLVQLQHTLKRCDALLQVEVDRRVAYMAAYDLARDTGIREKDRSEIKKWKEKKK